MLVAGRTSRTCLASSMPEIKGIRMSVSSKSGSYFSTSWRASSPLPALPARRKPSSSQGIMVQTASRSSSSSSATITVYKVAPAILYAPFRRGGEPAPI